MKMTPAEITSIVVQLIQEMTSLKSEGSLSLEQNLSQLGFDSLRLMNLVVAAEDKIGVQLNDTYLTAAHLKTIGTLVTG
jgi:acyl carrier protein